MVGRLETMVKPMSASRSAAHGFLRALGEDLVPAQQRAVDIGDDKCNAGHSGVRFN